MLKVRHSWRRSKWQANRHPANPRILQIYIEIEDACCTMPRSSIDRLWDSLVAKAVIPQLPKSRHLRPAAAGLSADAEILSLANTEIFNLYA
jgi:hypothetical protein